MKKYSLLSVLILLQVAANACPACEKNQPTFLKGITHGTGPNSQWDWVIISIMVLITLAVLFYSIKWLVRPGEKSTNHIKNFILND
ncbi:MAG: hypothetical protein ABI378_01470 [Chitinophagaceae bacterium]